ncbi:MAG: nuoL [Bacteroidetes bacterium]|nr:nuoL [Bacteroidota bacterium]
MQYTLLILLLPLLSFVVLGLMDTKWKARVAGSVGTLVLSVVAALSYYTAWAYFSTANVGGIYQKIVPLQTVWMQFSGQLHIDLGILLDPISVMMLVVISTVSLMVHIYSLAYMKGEKGFERYYAFLSLFTFSMLGLVVATNIFQMYIFWELVGVSSYLLIGFYYTKPEAVAASKKAFIVTRFADLGFLIGILILSFYTQTFDFGVLNSGNAGIFASASGVTFMGASVLSWAMALIFIGGAGKSAMFPLHIWLPDAMEGPTPVSALIHAATMVVAGVYLVARLFPVYVTYTPDVLHGIAYVGAFTSLFAAVIACTQTDIKRVLAFSTISQIGYMMVGLGVSGYGGHEGTGYMASMFHLFTHAMFKALLFLGAGSVIHAVHSNEMQKMGGLRKYMPVTHLVFLIGCLAIAGIFPLSGFFSKDEILAATYMYSTGLGIGMSFIAGLTAFYMFRLYFNIFWGKENSYEHSPHESPLAMTIPLVVLAFFSFFGGLIPFGKFVTSDGAAYTGETNYVLAIVSVLIGITGILLAAAMYRKKTMLPDRVSQSLGFIYQLARNKFYVDELYLFITKNVFFKGMASPVSWYDRHVVNGSVNGLAVVTQWVSVKIKGIQTGKVQQYAWVFLLGTLLMAFLILFL